MPNWLVKEGAGGTPLTTEDLFDMYAFMQTQRLIRSTLMDGPPCGLTVVARQRRRRGAAPGVRRKGGRARRIASCLRGLPLLLHRRRLVAFGVRLLGLIELLDARLPTRGR